MHGLLCRLRPSADGQDARCFPLYYETDAVGLAGDAGAHVCVRGTADVRHDRRGVHEGSAPRFREGAEDLGLRPPVRRHDGHGLVTASIDEEGEDPHGLLLGMGFHQTGALCRGVPVFDMGDPLVHGGSARLRRGVPYDHRVCRIQKGLFSEAQAGMNRQIGRTVHGDCGHSGDDLDGC